MTEKRREETAAAAIVARMTTFNSAWILSDVPLDIFVTNSIISVPGEEIFPQLTFNRRE
jgi:hypothetical protein